MAQPTNSSSSGKSTKSVLYTYTDANGDTITLFNDGSESIAFVGTAPTIVTMASNKDLWTPGANVAANFEVFANNNGDTLDGRTTTTGNLALFGANAKDILYAGGHNNYLDGGNGSDFLFGSAGKTTFVGGNAGD